MSEISRDRLQSDSRESIGGAAVLEAERPREAELGLAEEPAAEERSSRLMRHALGSDVEDLHAAPIAAVAGPAHDFTISFREAKERAVAEWTAGYVRALLDKFDGNLSRAARTVAMDRNHLRDLLRKYCGDGSSGGQ